LPDIQNQFADVYGPQGLEVVAMDPDSDDYESPESVADFKAIHGLTIPVLVQETAVTPTYSTIEGIYDGANPYPVDILVDKQGIIRYVAREYDPVTMDDLVQDLLAEP
jgi:hypothetical protein